MSSLPSVKVRISWRVYHLSICLDLLIPERVLNSNRNSGSYVIYFVPVVHVSPHTNG